jgi:hypothetical protein
MRYFNLTIISIFGLLGLYFLTRIAGVMVPPIFSDEAMYVHMAQIINEDWNDLFIGKASTLKPFFLWVIAFYLNIFDDPLYAGRLASITGGAFSLVGVYFLARELYNEKVAIVSSVIYIFCPFFIFFERWALMESWVTAFGVWAVWISMKIVNEKYLRKKDFIFLGLFLGLGFFTKPTALMFFPAPFIIFIIWNTYRKDNFFIYFLLTLFTVLVINLPYFTTGQNITFPNRNPIFATLSSYIPLNDLIELPLEIWQKNLQGLYVYFMFYLTFPLFLMASFGALHSMLLKDKKALTLVLLFIFPVLVILAIGNNIFSRYYVPAVPSIMVLVGWALTELSNFITNKLQIYKLHYKHSILSILLILIVTEGCNFSKNISKDPLLAEFPNFDRYQYLMSPITGHGIKEMAEFLIERSKEEPIDVMIDSAQGNPNDGIMTYLWKQPNINIVTAFWWPDELKLFPKGEVYPVTPSKYHNEATEFEVTENLKNPYFIFPAHPLKKKDFLDNNPEWKRVWSMAQLDGKSFLQIYKLNNSS